jgi:hypothetical protein
VSDALGQPRGERLTAELIAVIREHAFQAPARLLELCGTRRASADVCSTVGPAGGVTTRSAHAKEL